LLGTGVGVGIIYSIFYALIYILALVGGFIADRTRNYKGTIMVGLFIMAFGYFLLSIRGSELYLTFLLFARDFINHYEIVSMLAARIDSLEQTPSVVTAPKEKIS
jgi:dipeptide/tripeptide permease